MGQNKTKELDSSSSSSSSGTTLRQPQFGSDIMASETGQSPSYQDRSSDASSSSSHSSKSTPPSNPTAANHIVTNVNTTITSTDSIIFTSDDKKVGLDDFVLLKVLGKGNFAKVMQVEKKDTGKIYAMKILNKEKLKVRDQIEHTITERRLLATMEHPFLVRLIYAFQTSDKLYMIMNFVNGGELFFHLKRARKFKEPRARFYAAEICLALQHLHTHEYIYRDLKPENILMTKDGHVCLTDFGLAKELYNGRTFTLCGTPEYLAPEIILNRGHGKPIDWWSFGTLLYEMLVGIPPFYSDNVQEMYDLILSSDLYLPDFISVEAGDLLARLLERDPSKRLGSGPRGADEIKYHPFFVNSIPDADSKHNSLPTASPQKARPLHSWVQWWDDVYHKRIEAPFVPKLNGDADTHYFDEEFTHLPPVDSVIEDSKLDESVENAFKGFTFSAEEAAIRKCQKFVSTSRDSPASPSEMP